MTSPGPQAFYTTRCASCRGGEDAPCLGGATAAALFSASERPHALRVANVQVRAFEGWPGCRCSLLIGTEEQLKAGTAESLDLKVITTR